MLKETICMVEFFMLDLIFFNFQQF
uniref:Uncharacterized protein n=1 Tax=Rhizophora mucronata TaxID=61149 RepID=A0A2P2PF87_RHIMU